MNLNKPLPTTSCILWRGLNHGGYLSPTLISRLSFENKEIPDIKRKLLNIILTYPKQIPVRGSIEIISKNFSLGTLVSYFNRELCPATSQNDHFYINRQALLKFLEDIDKYQKENKWKKWKK